MSLWVYGFMGLWVRGTKQGNETIPSFRVWNKKQSLCLILNALFSPVILSKAKDLDPNRGLYDKRRHPLYLYTKIPVVSKNGQAQPPVFKPFPAASECVIIVVGIN